MRMELVECKSRATAKRRCPWAAAIMPVVGGFMCFESRADYEKAKQQR